MSHKTYQRATRSGCHCGPASVFRPVTKVCFYSSQEAWGVGLSRCEEKWKLDDTQKEKENWKTPSSHHLSPVGQVSASTVSSTRRQERACLRLEATFILQQIHERDIVCAFGILRSRVTQLLGQKDGMSLIKLYSWAYRDWVSPTQSLPPPPPLPHTHRSTHP